MVRLFSTGPRIVTIANRYILVDFLITFAMTLSVLTFVMCTAGLVRVIDYLARGVSGLFLLKLFLNNIPFMLMFSIPMSTLASTLLVVGRLSADGEITAMKACGFSLWQIASPLVLASMVLSAACFAVSASWAPNTKHAGRVMLRSVSVETPISLLEEGTWVRDFPGLVIYTGRKRGMKLEDVAVFQTGEDTARLSIRAKHGEIRELEEGGDLEIGFYDVRIYKPDPEHPRDSSKGTYTSAEYYSERIDASKFSQQGPLKKKIRDMTLRELIRHLGDLQALEPELDSEGYAHLRSTLLVQAHQRVTMALSCFAFSLLAIPLGLKSRRRESSVGIAISLLLIFFYYFFTILAEALVKHPEFRPELITWVPVFLAQVIGIALIQRNR